MADLSLDEIIATKRGMNFKVQFSNQSAGKQFQGKQGLKNKAFRATATSRLYHKQSGPAVRGTSNGASLGGPGKGQIDARDMITIKNRIKMPDARVKLVQKRINQRTFDARSKLQSKNHSQAGLRAQSSIPTGHQLGGQQHLQKTVRSATQQGFHPAHQQRFQQHSSHSNHQNINQIPGFHRSLSFQQVHVQDNNRDLVNFNVAVSAGISSNTAVGPLTRTLKNPLANGGAVVEDTGSSLKITRSIPDVTFDGQNLTVTRRLPRGSKNKDSSSSSFSGSGPRSRMDRTRGPVIQFQNDRYQPSPIQSPASGSTGRNRQDSSQDGQRARAPSPIQAPALKQTSVKTSSSLQTSSTKTALVSSSEYVSNTRVKTRKNVSADTPTAQEPDPPLGRLRPPPSASGPTLATKRPTLSDRQTERVPTSSRLPASGVPAAKRLAPHPSTHSEITGEQRTAASTKMGTKRRAPMSLSERFASSGGSSSPVIVDPVPVKKRRMPEPEPEKEDYEEDFEVKEGSEDEEEEDKESGVTLLSPLQGFRILVSNLHSTVTQDDIIELFGAIGPLKRANMLTRGQAEVAFIHKEHAVMALKKYHNRELDGQPMFVKLTTPLNAKVMKTPASENSPGLPASLKSSKKAVSNSAPVEIPLIHKALFKTGTDSAPSKSVRFTVKL